MRAVRAMGRDRLKSCLVSAMISGMFGYEGTNWPVWFSGSDCFGICWGLGVFGYRDRSM